MGWILCRTGIFDILISLVLDRRLESIPKVLGSLEVQSRRLYFLLDNNVALHNKTVLLDKLK